MVIATDDAGIYTKIFLNKSLFTKNLKADAALCENES